MTILCKLCLFASADSFEYWKCYSNNSMWVQSEKCKSIKSTQCRIICPVTVTLLRIIRLLLLIINVKVSFIFVAHFVMYGMQLVITLLIIFSIDCGCLVSSENTEKCCHRSPTWYLTMLWFVQPIAQPLKFYKLVIKIIKRESNNSSHVWSWIHEMIWTILKIDANEFSVNRLTD